MKSLLAAVLLISIVCSALATVQVRDVCILGGGIGGMSAAVFLKDRGYSIAVIEQADVTGGCCNTLKFDAPAGQQNYLDIGVQVFPNTTDSNSKGFGPWTIDSVAFFRRFGATVIPYVSSGSGTDYNVNMRNGVAVPAAPAAPADPNFFPALQRLFGLLAQYPWLDFAQVPDTVPPELLVPFSEYIVTHSLQPLLSIFDGVLFSGGLGYYEQMTTLYAMENLSPSILSLFINSPGITLQGGCRTLYDGFEAFLGKQNVVVNANINKVKRTGNQPITVKGKLRDPSGLSIKAFEYQCGSVVVAFPPTYDKVSDIFDLDSIESDYYQKVKNRAYFAVGIDVTGPNMDSKPFGLSNVDPSRDRSFPILPAFLGGGRSLTYGPMGGVALASMNNDLSADEMADVIQNQLSNIPNSVAQSAKLATIYKHEFQPYYTRNALSRTPSPPAQLRSLQGYRNTYVVGAVDSYASHVQIIQRTFNLITARFPVRVTG